MKKKEKIVILVLVIITVVLFAVLIIRNNISNSSEKVSESSSETTDETEESENVKTLSDGTKLNISEKLNEDREIDGIEITDIQLTESNNMTLLLATLTNTSDEVQGGYVVTLSLVDEDGEVLLEMKPFIPELEPGESTQLNTSAGFDYSGAYDFIIEK